MNENNNMLENLIKKQIKDVPSDKKLRYLDIKRISKFITSDIFDKHKCSIWRTYIDDPAPVKKSNIHINFYFNKKKMSLHRLLYSNFVDILTDAEYIKFTCDSKGKCCNVNHMKKCKYQDKNNLENSQKLNKIVKDENAQEEDIQDKPPETVINFD